MSYKLVFKIPKHCYIRWQAALAVLEDLLEDTSAPFNQAQWADALTLWERTNGCGSAACFGGYISVSPYCKALGFPKGSYGSEATSWLLDGENFWNANYNTNLRSELFHGNIGLGLPRAKILAKLKRRLKRIFKDSTGKELIAPMTFWV